MPGVGFGLRWGHTRLADLIAIAPGAAYFVGVAAFFAGSRSALLIPLLLAPTPLFVYALLQRTPLTSTEKTTLWCCTALFTALVLGFVISVNPFAGLVVVSLAIAAFACARFPVHATAAAFAAAGAFGSTQAFLHVSGQRIVDPLLAGLWFAALWAWLIARRGRGAWIWPGTALVGLYLLLSAAEIITSPHPIQAIQSFRATQWYLGAAILVAYAPWPERARPALTRALIVMAGLIGAYAAFRWAVGPAASERTLAERSLNNFLNGKLRPVGSFPTTKELASWSAQTLPFLTGMALASRGRWRLISAAAAIACIVGMLAANVRAGPAAAGAGVIVVVVLYQLANAFSGRRGASVPVAIGAAAAVAAAAFALTLGGQSDTSQRYSAILHPSSDPSYQARLIKWRTALNDISAAPLGHGLGTSGNVQARYGRFKTIGSIDVDNSYLKVAYEQGLAVMILVAAAFGLLLFGLARRALATRDPARAGPALAAAGTLAAMLVLFFVGDYIEGLQALGGWILVGLGIAAVSASEPA
jgi:hypothetical protein